MKCFWRWVGLCSAVLMCSVRADAGWIVEWRSVAIRTDGQSLPTEEATMLIENDRVRVNQPTSISLTDYTKERFSLLNPELKVFWSGTFDEYKTEMSDSRSRTIQDKVGRADGPSFKPRKVDEKKLPKIVVEKTGETLTLAGQPTEKYQVKSNGEVFAELWLATQLKPINQELNVERYLAHQRKMSEGMIGRATDSYNALYRSPAYLDLLRTGYPVQSVFDHGIAKYRRSVQSVREAAIADEEFVIPEEYRRVRLNELFPAPK